MTENSNSSAVRRPPSMSACLALALLLALSGAARAVAPDDSIAPGVAGLFVGEEKIVEGPVTAAEREANTVRLRLGTPPQSLTVSLIIGLLSSFPPEPERYYLGKTVRVVGTIQSFRGAAEMVMHDPAHIEVAGGTTTTSDAPGQTTVDALQRRVHELEEKVHQLERTGPAPR
jgi:hypothetical protein